MRTGIIGTKIGSTSYFNEDGTVFPVTLVNVLEISCSNKIFSTIVPEEGSVKLTNLSLYPFLEINIAPQPPIPGFGAHAPSV